MDIEVAQQIAMDLGAQKLRRPRENTHKGGWEVNFCCPIHNEKNPSASINTKTELFNCFVCGGMSLEQLVFEALDMDSYSEAKEYLEQYDIEGVTDYDKGKSVAVNVDEWGGTKRKADPTLPQRFFEHWGTPHRYIDKRVPDATVRDSFGIHYDPDKNRTIWPVHNVEGKIVGWSERWAFDPRYDGRDLILPRKVVEELDSQGMEFEEWEVRNPRWRHEYPKSRHLYGAHTLGPLRGKRAGLLVEGFTTTGWLRSLGFDEVVATGGAKLSREQAELLRSLFTSLYYAGDNDRAGREGLERAIKLCGPYMPIYVIGWDDDEKDFDGMDGDAVEERILAAPNYLKLKLG